MRQVRDFVISEIGREIPALRVSYGLRQVQKL